MYKFHNSYFVFFRFFVNCVILYNLDFYLYTRIRVGLFMSLCHGVVGNPWLDLDGFLMPFGSLFLMQFRDTPKPLQSQQAWDDSSTIAPLRDPHSGPHFL